MCFFMPQVQATACLKIGPTDEPGNGRDRHPCLPRKAAHISFCPFLTVGFEGKKSMFVLSLRSGDKPQESVLQVALMLFVTALWAYPFSQWGGSFTAFFGVSLV